MKKKNNTVIKSIKKTITFQYIYIYIQINNEELLKLKVNTNETVDQLRQHYLILQNMKRVVTLYKHKKEKYNYWFYNLLT